MTIHNQPPLSHQIKIHSYNQHYYEPPQPTIKAEPT